MGVIVSDRRTLIVGLGKTGLSCVRYLAAQGRKLAVADTREAPPGLAELHAGWPDVEVHLGAFDSDFFSAFSELIALAATVLNVSDDHMDRYPDKMAYYQAKQRIFRGCQYAIVNLDDALSTPMARNTLRFICFGMNRVNPETFSTRDDSVSGHPWVTWGLDNLIRADELGLIGRHNLSNVMAALGLGK